MLKVYINPSWYDRKDNADGGIRRVWEGQVKHLHKFDIEVVQNAKEADIIHNHGGDLISLPGVPSINTCHGMYWSRFDWGENYLDVNNRVIESMRHAVAHTSVSEWVAVAMRRGMLIYPEVIYHGINIEEWPAQTENGGYVLWNKARADHVSNPTDMQKLALGMKDVQFHTTIGKETENVKVIGTMPYEEMKGVVRNAGLYLCTARETFGINTLEAMASGVPVVGWRWGGQAEIVKQGETGYLATPGNYEELAHFVNLAFEHRERLGENARQDVIDRWGWEDKVEQYAEVYKRVNRYYGKQRPKVSVVVTAYKLDKYLEDCLASVQSQTLEDWECLVIDDGLQESTKEIVLRWKEKDRRFKYIQPPHNMGLPGARNLGAKLAKSLYIRHLDADDMLTPTALELEANALDEDWGTHIAYGHLQNVLEDGTPKLDQYGEPERSGWPGEAFSWHQQMSHVNQLPSACMVRRDVFDKSGGYRDRQKKAEDAHFWCVVTSQGFRAKKVTQAVTMLHRMRDDSKGALEWKADGTDGDWTAWIPWRYGASTYGEGRQKYQRFGRNHPNPHLVPFGAQGSPPAGSRCWPANDFAYPVVSVIITVGPGYEDYLVDCLDGVRAQTYPDWECIVVNDTGKEWDNIFKSPVLGFPWAKVVSTEGNYGVSKARNLGAEHARGELLAWLDADDFWLPWFLSKTVAMAEKHDGVIYTDVFIGEQGEDLEPYTYPEFKCGDVRLKMGHAGSSVVVPRWVHQKIVEEQGGWDEKIVGMEDWDYQFATQVYAHACAYRIDEPLFVYRKRKDTNREKHHDRIDEIVAYMDEKWPEYRKGEKQMGCGCKNKSKVGAPQSLGASSGTQLPVQQGVPDDAPTILMEYNGQYQAPITIRGPITGTRYKFGLMPSHRQKLVYKADIEELLNMRNSDNSPQFKIVKNEHVPGQDVAAFVQSNVALKSTPVNPMGMQQE